MHPISRADGRGLFLSLLFLLRRLREIGVIDRLILLIFVAQDADHGGQQRQQKVEQNGNDRCGHADPQDGMDADEDCICDREPERPLLHRQNTQHKPDKGGNDDVKNAELQEEVRTLRREERNQKNRENNEVQNDRGEDELRHDLRRLLRVDGALRLRFADHRSGGNAGRCRSRAGNGSAAGVAEAFVALELRTALIAKHKTPSLL